MQSSAWTSAGDRGSAEGSGESAGAAGWPVSLDHHHQNQARAQPRGATTKGRRNLSQKKWFCICLLFRSLRAILFNFFFIFFLAKWGSASQGADLWVCFKSSWPALQGQSSQPARQGEQIKRSAKNKNQLSLLTLPLLPQVFYLLLN